MMMQDRDGGLSFSEMLSMLRRMGMRGTQSAMATELDYIRALKVHVCACVCSAIFIDTVG